MATTNENHEAQRVYWDGAGGDKWIRRAADVDTNVAPAQRAAIDSADIHPGARVLDIGCGCGGSTLAIARRAGPTGRVLGVDISHAMIAEAAKSVPVIHAPITSAIMKLPVKASAMISFF